MQDIETVCTEMGRYVFRRSVALADGSVYGERLKLIPALEQEALGID